MIQITATVEPQAQSNWKMNNYITEHYLFHESLVLKSCSVSPFKQVRRPFLKTGVYFTSRMGFCCKLKRWTPVKDGNSSKTNSEDSLSSDANNLPRFSMSIIADFGSPISQTLACEDPNLRKWLLLPVLFKKTREPTVPCPMAREGVSSGWEKTESSENSTLGR